MTQLYDRIGTGYSEHRHPDPRIARSIERALGGAEPVVNVGAGSGSYEPTNRGAVAVEPSLTMIQQRSSSAAPAVQALAAALPFRDASFAASLAILTVHHWPARGRGLTELARVSSGPVVLLTWDPAVFNRFWLVEDYLPEIVEADRRNFPTLDEMRSALGALRVEKIPVPHDCTDGFLGAYWRRPEAYLDAGVRSAISTFSRMRDAEAGLSRLRADLESGAWARRHEALLGLDELDLGYRLIVGRR